MNASRFHTAVPIGAGATGEVLRAWDPALERDVALKFLLRTDPESVARLHREAQAQARIDHPNVARVYDVGERDGRPYIAMQYVDGEPLDVAAADLPVEGKLHVFLDVARAVQAAHAVGLLHRDLKPSNILVERGQDGALHPYVLDFGISREIESAGQTETGMILGTPGYLSPEQARGMTIELDRRSDVFSLGTVLYELLGGEAPFAAETAVGSLIKVLEAEPPALRSLRPNLPADLEAVVGRCLEKDPDRRYGSVRELADDIERFLDGRPTVARPIGRLERGLRWARRHRALAAAASVALLLTLVGLGAAIYFRFESQRAAIVNQAFGRDVERIRSIIRRDYTLPLHDTRPAQRLVEQEIESLHLRVQELGRGARGPGYFAIGSGHLALGRHREAVDALRIARAAGADDPETNAVLGLSLSALYREEVEALTNLADEERREERRLEVERSLRDPALDALARAIEGSSMPTDYVEGMVAYTEGRWDDAAASGAQSFEDNVWFYEGKLLEANASSRKARELIIEGRIAEGLDLLEYAGEQHRIALAIGRSDPAVHAGNCQRSRLAMVASMMTADAVTAHYEEALQACRDGIAADPDRAVPHGQLANLEWRMAEHRWDQGEDPRPWARRSIEAAQRALELRPDSVTLLDDLATAHGIVAQYRASLGEDPRAELARVIEISERILELAGENSYALAGLASAFQTRGVWNASEDGDPTDDFELAIDALERAVAVEPIYAWYGNLAGVRRRLAQHRAERGLSPLRIVEQGIEEARRAVELNPEYFGYWHELGQLHLVHARWLEREGAGVESVRVEAAAGMEAVRRGLKIAPDSEALRATLGRLEELADLQPRGRQSPTAVTRVRQRR